ADPAGENAVANGAEAVAAARAGGASGAGDASVSAADGAAFAAGSNGGVASSSSAGGGSGKEAEPLYDRTELFRLEKCLLAFGYGRWPEIAARLHLAPGAPGWQEGDGLEALRPQYAFVAESQDSKALATVPPPASTAAAATDEDSDLDPERVLNCDSFLKHLEKACNKILHARIRLMYFLQLWTTADVLPITENPTLSIPCTDGVEKRSRLVQPGAHTDPCLCFASRCQPRGVGGGSGDKPATATGPTPARRPSQADANGLDDTLRVTEAAIDDRPAVESDADATMTDARRRQRRRPPTLKMSLCPTTSQKTKTDGGEQRPESAAAEAGTSNGPVATAEEKPASARQRRADCRQHQLPLESLLVKPEEAASPAAELVFPIKRRSKRSSSETNWSLSEAGSGRLNTLRMLKKAQQELLNMQAAAAAAAAAAPAPPPVLQPERFRSLSNLNRKSDSALTSYFHSYYHLCRDTCLRSASETVVALGLRGYDGRTARAGGSRRAPSVACCGGGSAPDLNAGTRFCPHPQLEERLKLAQRSPDLPEWWQPGLHDLDLLRGAAKHGLARTRLQRPSRSRAGLSPQDPYLLRWAVSLRLLLTANSSNSVNRCDGANFVRWRSGADNWRHPAGGSAAADSRSPKLPSLKTLARNPRLQAGTEKLRRAMRPRETDAAESTKTDQVKQQEEAVKPATEPDAEVNTEANKNEEVKEEADKSAKVEAPESEAAVKAETAEPAEAKKEEEAETTKDEAASSEVKPTTTDASSVEAGTFGFFYCSSSSAAAAAREWSIRFATNIAVGWPKDRTISQRLEPCATASFTVKWPNPRGIVAAMLCRAAAASNSNSNNCCLTRPRASSPPVAGVESSIGDSQPAPSSRQTGRHHPHGRQRKTQRLRVGGSTDTDSRRATPIDFIRRSRSVDSSASGIIIIISTTSPLSQPTRGRKRKIDSLAERLLSSKSPPCLAADDSGPSGLTRYPESGRLWRLRPSTWPRRCPPSQPLQHRLRHLWRRPPLLAAAAAAAAAGASGGGSSSAVQSASRSLPGLRLRIIIGGEPAAGASASAASASSSSSSGPSRSFKHGSPSAGAEHRRLATSIYQDKAPKRRDLENSSLSTRTTCPILLRGRIKRSTRPVWRTAAEARIPTQLQQTLEVPGLHTVYMQMMTGFSALRSTVGLMAKIIIRWQQYYQAAYAGRRLDGPASGLDRVMPAAAGRCWRAAGRRYFSTRQQPPRTSWPVGSACTSISRQASLRRHLRIIRAGGTERVKSATKSSTVERQSLAATPRLRLLASSPLSLAALAGLTSNIVSSAASAVGGRLAGSQGAATDQLSGRPRPASQLGQRHGAPLLAAHGAAARPSSARSASSIAVINALSRLRGKIPLHRPPLVGRASASAKGAQSGWLLASSNGITAGRRRAAGGSASFIVVASAEQAAKSSGSAGPAKLQQQARRRLQAASHQPRSLPLPPQLAVLHQLAGLQQHSRLSSQPTHTDGVLELSTKK
uniref:SANT domain-containing protein n=1 Tax=Macrostomum lignano TaxID=282301 RepID=A0A1I8FB58_9PLAT